MAFFGKPNAYLGIDIGTSTIKIVEIIDRNKRKEVATYAEAAVPNLITSPKGKEDDAIRKTAQIISRMMDEASVSADTVIAALPSTVVFSSVINLPNIPENEIEKAVQFAARDIVPADLDDMVLGWNRVGGSPHMSVEKKTEEKKDTKEEPKPQTVESENSIPIFITAAPRDIVERYTKVMGLLQVTLVALEVETFPLARSLLNGTMSSGLIVDMGDRVTTFHIIDAGTPRVSHTIENGGHAVTKSIAQALGISLEQAEEVKTKYGLSDEGSKKQKVATQIALHQQIDQATALLDIYKRNNGGNITQSVLVGGGAKLKGIQEYWGEEMRHKTIIGNPWKGLAYPKELEQRLRELGLTYGVAVGLALRGFQSTS